MNVIMVYLPTVVFLMVNEVNITVPWILWGIPLLHIYIYIVKKINKQGPVQES